MTRTNRLWCVPAMLVFAAVAAPMSGCTLLVSFDDPAADAGTVVPVTKKDAAPAGEDDDATVPEAGPVPTGDDASPNVPVDANSGTRWAIPDQSKYALPGGIMDLYIPDGCDPCTGFTSSTGAFTCGSEHTAAPGCASLPATAVYFCGPHGSTDDKLGYNCPVTEPCYPGGSFDALCDPCADHPSSIVVTNATDSLKNPTECITCNDQGKATDAELYDSSAMACK